MKKKIAIFVSLVLFALTVYSVNAIGMNRDYLEDNTLRLHTGDSAIYGVRLPNTGEEDVIVAFKVESTDDIAKVIDPKDTYLLPAGVLNTPINIRLSVPSNAEVGTTYGVSLYVAEAGEGDGDIAFNTGAGTSFTVEVIGEEEESTVIARTANYVEPNSGFPVTLILVLIVICVFIGVGFIIYIRKWR